MIVLRALTRRVPTSLLSARCDLSLSARDQSYLDGNASSESTLRYESQLHIAIGAILEEPALIRTTRLHIHAETLASAGQTATWRSSAWCNLRRPSRGVSDAVEPRFFGTHGCKLSFGYNRVYLAGSRWVCAMVYAVPAACPSHG